MKKAAYILRPYLPTDCSNLHSLYQGTIKTIASRDYTPAQITAWLNTPFDESAWNQRFLESRTLVAEKLGEIIGFANMEPNGYLDCLYVHRDFQREGIAGNLVKFLENGIQGEAVETFTVYASITAKPFFESRGYRVVRENFVERDGVVLKNYLMEKSRIEMLQRQEEVCRRAVEELKACQSEAEMPRLLWEVITQYEGQLFFTSKNLPFQYRVRGGELFCDRKAKSITQATVVKAYQKICAARNAGEPITGPKMLGIFGAPYIWSILKTVGLAGEAEGKKKRKKTDC
ncbi:MAG: GNAT family N-acetyltransferase [Eubacteriales bacterium]|nr:GNAT family N-acetyltransferase [Eubacteriales bacterium]